MNTDEHRLNHGNLCSSVFICGYLRPLAGGVLGLAFTAIAFHLVGASLGLLLAGLLAGIVLLPLLDDRELPLLPRIFLAGCIIDSVALIWLVAVFFTEFTFWQWLQSYLVLISATWLLLGLRDVRTPAALVVCIGIAWIASPSWLSDAMLGPHGDAIASFVTRFNPIFALNRVMIDQGAWTHLPIAYGSLTHLGQDVAYTLPDGVWPCVLLHSIMAIALQMLARAVGRRTARC